jgi:hypothetical protein
LEKPPDEAAQKSDVVEEDHALVPGKSRGMSSLLSRALLAKGNG